jgi:hypothetical protein
MRRLWLAAPAMALAACSAVSIADRYGNQYGDWYNPGGNYTWQLGLCEHSMNARGVPAMDRKSAMRCCMHDHGVPVDAPPDCGA